VVACALVGEIAIELTTGFGAAAVTVTLLEVNLVASATLVAVTVSVPVLAGAVYTPAAVIVPSSVFHVTAVFEVVPSTLAL
jgi:hypothetical protein